MESITYEIIVDTDESDRRLELLHDNVKQFGTVFNTVAPGTQLSGVLRRRLTQGARKVILSILLPCAPLAIVRARSGRGWCR